MVPLFFFNGTARILKRYRLKPAFLHFGLNAEFVLGFVVRFKPRSAANSRHSKRTTEIIMLFLLQNPAPTKNSQDHVGVHSVFPLG